MAQSPYLDHGIIESLILDSTFPDLMLRNIMLANPDAPKASHLMGLIYQRNMPAWMVKRDYKSLLKKTLCEVMPT